MAQCHTSPGLDTVPRDARSWTHPESSPPAPSPAVPRRVPGSPCSPPLVWGSRSSPSARCSQELWKALGQLWAAAFPLSAPGASSLLGQGSGSCSAQQPGGSLRVRAAARGVPLARRALVQAVSAAGQWLAAGAVGSRWAVALGQAAASEQGRRGCLQAAAEFGSSSTAIRSSAKERKVLFKLWELRPSRDITAKFS